MNTYISTVQAGKIEGIRTPPRDGGTIELEGGEEVEVSRGYLNTRKPAVGGYYIKHTGEELFLSAAAFESRFERVTLAPAAEEPAEAPPNFDE